MKSGMAQRTVMNGRKILTLFLSNQRLFCFNITKRKITFKEKIQGLSADFFYYRVTTNKEGMNKVITNKTNNFQELLNIQFGF